MVVRVMSLHKNKSLSSPYVFTAQWVLAGFRAQWPVLKTMVAGFDFQLRKPIWRFHHFYGPVSWWRRVADCKMQDH